MYTYEYLPHASAMALHGMHRLRTAREAGAYCCEWQVPVRVVSLVPGGKVAHVEGAWYVCQLSGAV